MLLIALVSVGGFSVLAQRRLRAIGMLESCGATDRHVRLVVSANGTVVGVVGATFGLVLGLVVWLTYRPSLEQSAHHVIGLFALPWTAVAAAMVLAVMAAYFAASRPARAITRVPIVQALSGRPAPPRQVHRSAIPGIVFLVVAFLLLGYSGAESSAAAGSQQGNGSVGAPELVLGIVLLVPGLVLLAPFFLSLAARLGRRAPIASRLALRDLARYRARSGSALAAISVGVLVAVIVMLAAAARYGNVLDYAGPNLASNQLALHVTRGAHGQVEVTNPARAADHAAQIARGLSAQLIALETPYAGLSGDPGRAGLERPRVRRDAAAAEGVRDHAVPDRPQRGHLELTMTAVTAGALGFLGALLGTLGGYIAMIGWLRSTSLNGGIAALGNIPVADLLLLLVGMPAFAAIVGWLLAGRQPEAMAHQAIE
jgi:hypothetical protein